MPDPLFVSGEACLAPTGFVAVFSGVSAQAPLSSSPRRRGCSDWLIYRGYLKPGSRLRGDDGLFYCSADVFVANIAFRFAKRALPSFFAVAGSCADF